MVRDKETHGIYVLKLYLPEQMKSYEREKSILIRLRDEGKCQLGFPLLISIMEGQTHAELLMEALGANLKSLHCQTANQQFTPATVLKIGI